MHYDMQIEPDHVHTYMHCFQKLPEHDNCPTVCPRATQTVSLLGRRIRQPFGGCIPCGRKSSPPGCSKMIPLIVASGLPYVISFYFAMFDV